MLGGIAEIDIRTAALHEIGRQLRANRVGHLGHGGGLQRKPSRRPHAGRVSNGADRGIWPY
jgi:hypothetical protein